MKYKLLITIETIVVLGGLALVVACSPMVSDSDILNKVKANTDALVAAKTTIQQQASLISTLQGQVTQLQKQVAASENKSSTYATKTELAQAMASSTASSTQTQILSRLAAVEGQAAVLNANFSNYRTEVNAQLSGMRVTIDNLAAMFQGTSPALAQLEALRQQVVALQAKMTEHGW